MEIKRDERTLPIDRVVIDELVALTNRERQENLHQRQQMNELLDARGDLYLTAMEIAKARIGPGCGGVFRYDEEKGTSSFSATFGSDTCGLTIKIDNLTRYYKVIPGGWPKDKSIRLDSRKLTSEEEAENIRKLQARLEKDTTASGSFDYYGVGLDILDKTGRILIRFERMTDEGSLHGVGEGPAISMSLTKFPIDKRAALYRELSGLIAPLLPPQNEAATAASIPQV